MISSRPGCVPSILFLPGQVEPYRLGLQPSPSDVTSVYRGHRMMHTDTTQTTVIFEPLTPDATLPSRKGSGRRPDKPGASEPGQICGESGWRHPFPPSPRACLIRPDLTGCLAVFPKLPT
ncbi:hypothetical protein RRG08_036234 [Elysia crispata]|uniref:Uncharacterized protein n=1 Tax=Elysia crispata TaxID=231223 RepID=A0AAE0XEJ3_9GAST|nr:hypothetical protein RRG08_036234 [Elysia crispata]